MVVPNGQVRHRLAQPRKARLCRLRAVGLLQIVQQPRLGAGIHSVPAKNEQIGPAGQDRVPDRLSFFLVYARSKGNLGKPCGPRRQGAVVLQPCAWQRGPLHRHCAAWQAAGQRCSADGMEKCSTVHRQTLLKEENQVKSGKTIAAKYGMPTRQ